MVPSSGSTTQTSPSVTRSGLSSSPTMPAPESAASSTSAMSRSAVRSTSVTKSRRPSGSSRSGPAAAPPRADTARRRSAAVLATCSKSKADTILQPSSNRVSCRPCHAYSRGFSRPASCTSATGSGRCRTGSTCSRATIASICVVDLHAITGKYEHERWPSGPATWRSGCWPRDRSRSRAMLFVQSHVPEHSRAPVAAQHVTPIGELERMTQFKDKSQRFESVPAGC